jgi:hypothetical protein
MGMAQRLGVEDNDSEWMRAHAALSRLAKTRALADAEEGRWLLAARRSAAHVHLGFGSFGEYIERLFGYTARSTQEKLRVAESLEELPELTQALQSGVLSWSALRELTRVAVADTEHEWLVVSQGKTVRQLEELVAGKSPGDVPGAAGLPAARRHVLRFEVAPETFALFREALAWLRRRSGDDLRDDDSLLLSIALSSVGPRTTDAPPTRSRSPCVPRAAKASSERTASSSWSETRSSPWLSVTASIWATFHHAPPIRTPPSKGGHRVIPRIATWASTVSRMPTWASTVSPGFTRRKRQTSTAKTRARTPRWTRELVPLPQPAPRLARSRALAPNKAFRRRCGARCCCGISTAAGCRAAETRRFSICITSSFAPRAAATNSGIS